VRASRLLNAVVATAVLAAGAVACAGTAFAQLRSIPDDAKRGQIRHVREMIVEIDGRRSRCW